jgi:hypothetical protein
MKTTKDKVIAYLQKGLTPAEVAHKAKCSKAFVYKVRKEADALIMEFTPKVSTPVIPPVSTTTVGVKHDLGKVRKSLLPEGVLYEILEVLEHGASKYGEFNWKYVSNGQTRYYDAADRHIEEWWNGEILDPDSGCHHLAHAICSLMFAMHFDKK